MSAEQLPKTTQDEQISICDVLKDSTTSIIRKLESTGPTYFQMYSDLHMEWLHSLDNVFGTCYISQKEFFDKMGIDQSTLRTWQEYLKTVTEAYKSQIDISMSMHNSYVENIVKSFEIFNQGTKLALDRYAEGLGTYNKFLSKS